MLHNMFLPMNRHNTSVGVTDDDHIFAKFADINRVMGGLYIHIPFCKRKCSYCAFYSGGFSESLADSYVTAVVNELHERQHELRGKADTIYIGGGTPSLLLPRHNRRLMNAVEKVISPEIKEFTIEANPDDIDHERIEAWKEAGVNRVSLGVQSLDDELLKRIGRRHTAADAVRAIEAIRETFSNISVDLIYALPGQDRKMWRNTLKDVISLDPDHISAYNLTYEDGTPLDLLLRQGRIKAVSDDDTIKMFEDLDLLLDNGYEQYEISNFAKKGMRSIHNSSYWKGLPYLGLGPAAHSYDGARIRRSNPSDLKGYVRHFSDSDLRGTPYYIEEDLTDDELREEYVLTRLRTKEGIDLSEYGRRFGTEALRILEAAARSDIRFGNAVMQDGSLALTRKGIMLSDQVMVNLI